MSSTVRAMPQVAALLHVAIETPDQPAVIDLLQASDAYAASLYPSESNHLLDLPALLRPEVCFIVARDGEEALGCAAIVDSGEGWAEIKRMFVTPAARGRQVGRRLLEELEKLAVQRGAAMLRLETGIKQSEALGLYRSAGFRDIPPFGAYQPDPLSVFMEKPLAAPY